MAGYVCFGVLGFLLLILPPAFGVANLKNVINYLHGKYGSGENQYAIGINVPVDFCNNVKELDQNVFPDDIPENVKNDMDSKTKRVYVNTAAASRLIGARPKFEKPHIHAEYLLLRYTNPSYMQNLMNKNKNVCAVFFSLMSPCVTKCSAPTGTDSILPGLDMFRTHTGPKAFVFRTIYDKDDVIEWEKNLLNMNTLIPMYRCFQNECVKCVTSDNKVDPLCIAK